MVGRLRILVSLMLIGAVLWASSGLSVVGLRGPAAGAAADPAGEWFPCRDHGCGCVSAEMCRTSCCCVKPAAVAAVARPAASCCTGGQTTASAQRASDTPDAAADSIAAACDDSSISFRVVFRTQRCSGRQLLTAFGAVSWLVQVSTLTTHVDGDDEPLAVACERVPDSRVHPFDPPPPRRA